MRILHVTPGYYPELGGVERHVQDVSEALARLGHQVAVVTATPDARLPQHELIGGVEVRRLPAIGPRHYRLPLGLMRYLGQQQFDIVHAHNYHALPLLGAALAAGARCVVSPYYHGRAHSRAADALHRLYRPAGRLALRRAARIVCLSAGEAALVSRDLGVARERIAIIPSIITLPAAMAAREPGDGAERLILSVGRLEPYKRIDRAIAALAHLPTSYRLAIVGEGSEQPALERLVAERGLAGRVQMLGRIGDAELASCYRRAHVAISFSEAESFGRAVVEALAYGCQMVCGDIPAFRDLAAAHPEAVALAAPDARDQDIAALIAAAAERPAGQSDVRRYSWRSVAAQLLDVYAAGAVSPPAWPDRSPRRRSLGL